MEAEKQKEKEEFLKLFNDDIKIYPTTGYTMYLYIESEENLNKSEIGIFILKDGKYELRGKSSNFIDYDGKKLVVINVQLETNETSFVLSLKNNGSIIEPNNEIYDKFDILEIGKNNLTNNIEDIPTIKF